jgi:Mg-chelatase subunit ChlD
VLTVAVQDEAGRPVPFARVTIHCGDGNSLSLATVADGTAVFYPGLDRLGDRVRVAVTGAGARTIEVTGPGAQRQGFTVRSRAAPVRKFDLMLAIDTTGSMGDEIAYLKSELRTILADLRRSHPGLDIRLGLVAYRDLGDEYVTRTFPFTGNLESMQASLSAQYAGGGGDYPEAMDLAMARAVAQDWRPDAAKSLLLVADAPPHDENIGKTWRAAEAARAKRIQIVPVAASGVADTAEYVMRAMAAATQSRYIFLTDDSGIGNPHAPPAVDCYLVTRLDRLVRRVLDSQISGRRIEPREGEVIRSVGQYDNGKCILPPDYPVQEQY